jgi:hypothetical protein
MQSIQIASCQFVEVNGTFALTSSAINEINDWISAEPSRGKIPGRRERLQIRD